MEQIISLITALGVGGVLGAFLKSKFDHQKEVNDDIHQLKRKRYGAILIQMLSIIDPDRGIKKAQEFRPDLKTLDDFKKEVEVEMLHGIVFANDDVIRKMSAFLRKPDHETYVQAAVAMRKDLWGKNTKIDKDILKNFIS